MTRPKRKDFLAMPLLPEPEKCKLVYFYTRAEAVAWLRLNGGGVVKQRGAGTTFVPGFGRVKGWGVVQAVEALDYASSSSDVKDNAGRKSRREPPV